MDLKSELKRKTVHLTGSTVSILYLYTNKDVVVSFLIVVIVVFLALEPIRLDKKLRDEIKIVLSHYIDDLEKMVDGITRTHEKKSIGAHIYFAIGSLTVVWFFPFEIAIGSISVAVVSDALASLIGKTFGGKVFGKIKFKNKSFEGFLAYSISAYVILSILNLPFAFLCALIGALTEFFGIPPDDNLSCQIAIGCSLYVLSFF
jgi:dolichol kinase